MANTSNASQSATMADQFQLGKLEWKESKKKTNIVCSHCSNRSNSWGKKTRSCKLRWLKVFARRAVAPFLSRPTPTEVTVRWHTHPDGTVSCLIMHMRKTFSLIVFLLGPNLLIPHLISLTPTKLLVPSEESERRDNGGTSACLTPWGPTWGPKTNGHRHHHASPTPWSLGWANRKRRCHQASNHRKQSC